MCVRVLGRGGCPGAMGVGMERLFFGQPGDSLARTAIHGDIGYS